MNNQIKFVITGLTTIITLLQIGCASIPDDSGLSEVKSLIKQKSDGKLVTVADVELNKQMTEIRLSTLLSNTLSMKSAEEISLQLNPLLNVKLAEVGLAEADYAQAGRLRNPGFSYERIATDEDTGTLLFDINGLLLMPLKRRIEEGRLQIARYTAAGEVLNQVAKTREAWIRAVADQHQLALIERALEAVETSNTLTRQMSAIGHSSTLESAESEVFVGETKTALSKQRMIANSSRENLIRQLGLWGEHARELRVPNKLPELPKSVMKYQNIAQMAIDQRLDVQQAKFNLENKAQNLKLTKRMGFVNVFEAGPVREKSEEGRETGYEIELVLPIFDLGGIKKERARIAMYQAQEEAKAIAIDAASQAREALWNYRSAEEIVRHFQNELLPLRQRISQENLLRYNGMLISVFDLLADARDSANTSAGYIDALKNFWLADLGIKSALVGASGPSVPLESNTAMPGPAAAGGH